MRIFNGRQSPIPDKLSILFYRYSPVASETVTASSMFVFLTRWSNHLKTTMQQPFLEDSQVFIRTNN